MKHPLPPNYPAADSVRRILFGGISAENGTFGSFNSSINVKSIMNDSEIGIGHKMCSCLSQLEQICIGPDMDKFGQYPSNPQSNLAFNSEVGRMLYTISILLMFSLVILLLMIRSIRRSRSTVEVETLLDAMRFREELDLEMRQKKRLRKAKKKVTAWLCRGNGAKLWQSSPQILLPNTTINAIRTNSIQSSGSFIPEIVISEHLPPSGNSAALLPPTDYKIERQNSCTPSLSLIYDFSSRKNSQVPSSSSPDQVGLIPFEFDLNIKNESENGRLSQSSALSDPIVQSGQCGVPNCYGKGLALDEPPKGNNRSIGVTAK